MKLDAIAKVVICSHFSIFETLETTLSFKSSLASLL